MKHNQSQPFFTISLKELAMNWFLLRNLGVGRFVISFISVIFLQKNVYECNNIKYPIIVRGGKEQFVITL